MVRRIAPLLTFLGLMLGVVFLAHPFRAEAIPDVNVVVPASAQLYPVVTSAGQANYANWTTPGTNDTLPRFASDSVFVTDSVFVQDARLIQLVAWVRASDAADTIVAPLPQIRGPQAPGQWASGSNLIGGTGTSDYPAPATALTPNEQVVWVGVAELGASGTPMPMPGRWYRWRVKLNELRRYNAAAGATLAPTGKINFTVRAWRF